MKNTAVAKVIWKGTIGGRRVRVVRFKGRLEVEYAIKGDPGFWRVDPKADPAVIMVD